MKTVLISLTILATAVLFWFCKQPKYAPGAFPDKQLRWGSGGGIVGRESIFTLLENGQIFKAEPGGQLTELPKTGARQAKAIFKTATTLDLIKLDFQHPGNVYDFLEYQEGSVIQRITWGDQKYPVDAKIKDLFAQLKALIK